MAETGLSDGHGDVETGIELIAPMAEEMAFANAVGATQEHEAAKGCALGEVLLGLLDLRVLFLKGLGMITGKGDAGGTPLVGVTVESGVGGRTLVVFHCHQRVVWMDALVSGARSFGRRIGC